MNRITAEQECQIAREIRDAERRTREAIAGIEPAERVLRRRPTRTERTRAGAVDRLVEAVAACDEEAKIDPEVRAWVSEARLALGDAENLRWKLAMSAKRIARLMRARSKISTLAPRSAMSTTMRICSRVMNTFCSLLPPPTRRAQSRAMREKINTSG